MKIFTNVMGTLVLALVLATVMALVVGLVAVLSLVREMDGRTASKPTQPTTAVIAEHATKATSTDTLTATFTPTDTSTATLTPTTTPTDTLTATLTPSTTPTDTPTATVTASPTATEMEAARASDEVIVTVNHESIYLRSGPGTDYPTVGWAPQGEQFIVIACHRNWYLARDTDNRMVWLASWLVDPARTELAFIPAAITIPAHPAVSPTPQDTPEPVELANVVCSPGEWFGCGEYDCRFDHSAQCNSAGTGYECHWNPGTCNDDSSSSGSGGSSGGSSGSGDGGGGDNSDDTEPSCNPGPSAGGDPYGQSDLPKCD